MASIINAATSGGLISTADTSGILQLQTAGTTAVTVDASQNVGLGVAVPTKDVEVSGELRVQASATGGTGVGIEAFASGGISYFTSYNRTTSAYAPASIIGSTVTITGDTTVSGTLKNSATISVGNATPSASGAGITFPATQSASTDANTLDDYEEGTWTPGFAFGGGATGIVYAAATGGRYVKIGRFVHLTGFLSTSNKGSSTGTATLTGIPFSPVSTGEDGDVAQAFSYAENITFTGTLGVVTGSINPPRFVATASAVAITNLTNTNFANASTVIINLTYQAS